jgi:TonB family protein
MLLRATVHGLVLSSVAAAGVFAQDVRIAPGPLEKQARQVTPENPVPRRLTSRPVEYPAEMRRIGGRGLITIQLTLDAGGRVAEIRNTRSQLVQVSGSVNQEVERQTTDALTQSAVDAVREWTFAPPAAAPLTFPVAFMFIDGTVDVTLAPPSPPARGRGAAPAISAQAPLSPPWPAAEGAYRYGDVTVPPRQTRNIRPDYPREAQSQRIGGVVILEIVVGPNGKVRDARVLRSVPQLDQAALNAVRQWEYTPAMLNGVAVPVLMTVTTTFTIN